MQKKIIAAAIAAAATSLNRIVSNASRLGVKGRENLGDGLGAIWQLEAQFDLTNSGGTPFASTRNSNVGLEGGFGTALNVTGRVGTANGNASFNTRQKNVLQYWTPSFNGFQAKLAYAPDNAKKASVAAGGDKSVWSLSAAYDNETLYAAYAYEAHKDALSTAASLTDAAHRLVGAYKIGSGQVGLTYERLSSAAKAFKDFLLKEGALSFESPAHRN